MLTVTIAASDRTLLSVEERRAALRVSDASRDPALEILERQAVAAITAACRVRGDGIAEPTFREETLTETFALPDSRGTLVLARRPVLSVTSVVENGVALTASDYRLDRGGGLLERRSGGYGASWPAGLDIAVVYVAGYATVPQQLKTAVARQMAAQDAEASRDPLLRSETIPGVVAREWWVEPGRDQVVAPDVERMLAEGGFLEHWW